MKPSDLKTALAHLIPGKQNVLITGQPGIGKSDIVAQAAADADANLIIFHPAVSDPTDYKGLPALDPDNPHAATFLPFGELTTLIHADKLTVAFLDDLGQAPPAVQSAVMQLILARRVNGHKVSDHVTFIAATNRKKDRANVSGILEPVKSRFACIIELAPDLDDWTAWSLKNGMPTELIAFIRFRPHFLTAWEPTAEIVNGPCPRTLTHAGRLYNLGLPTALEYEIYKGAAGKAFAAEFTGFLKIYRNLPDPDAVLLNPKTADVPTDPQTLYALAGALSRKANPQTFSSILQYAERLEMEFNVLLTVLSAKTSPDCQRTREFINWTTKNQNIFLG